MENSKGQNSHLNDQSQKTSTDHTDQGYTTRRTQGTVDMDAQESVGSGTSRQTRGSGLSTKRNVTGSDYDGQNSGE